MMISHEDIDEILTIILKVFDNESDEIKIDPDDYIIDVYAFLIEVEDFFER